MGDRLNTQLSENEEMLLASMIGRRFDEYRCDPFFVTKAVYGTLGLLIEGDAYELTNYLKVEDHYFGYREDVSRFALKHTREDELKSALADTVQIRHAVGDTIQDILLVQETETMFKRSGVTHRHDYTRAIIFCFQGYQLGFERGVDFSEDMCVIQGTNTLDELGPADQDLDDDTDEYDETVERRVVSLASGGCVA